MKMTDDEARALGERWIKAGGGSLPSASLPAWESALAMLERNRPAGTDPYVDGYDLALGKVRDAVLFARSSFDWPDLRDPATRGAALDVVRERWGRPDLTIRYDPQSSRPWWPAFVPALSQGGFRTEAETLVAALEAAPVAPAPH